jgi:sec-independent protein translocase protein TatC
MIEMDSYISTITTITLASGLIFELPMLVYFLTKIGIITPDFMRRFRKHSVVVILLVAAIITPSPDITSQMLVAIPIYLLYETSIFVSAYVIRNKKD